MKKLHVAIAQINPCVGSFDDNHQHISDAISAAVEQGADAIVFPELVITGYPPEDLLFRPAFLARVEAAIDKIKQLSSGITVVIGASRIKNNSLYNMAIVLRDGKQIGEYAKQHLPNYRVFDEKRYFTAGTETVVIDIAGVKTALLICEDIWKDAPVKKAKAAGAECIFVLNASPFRVDKAKERLDILNRQAQENALPIVYVNLIGGQDELVFDGHSMVVDRDGDLLYQLEPFKEQTGFVEITFDEQSQQQKPKQELLQYPKEKQVYQALVMGVRDYVSKNGFPGVLLGLSGGIDSALTLAIAVDALGAENVEAVMMPFRYTADISVEDAAKQADKLAVKYREIPIEQIFTGFMDALSREFEGLERDVTEENIQARSRGVLLMALSNKLGKMLLATGNKSEMSMGYATLYGDMNGGFAPLKDVYKTLVYYLSRYRNTLGDGEIIPDRVITRPPSAELAPDQKDEDSLPPYDILDAVLRMFIEEFKSVDEIVAQGFEREMVQRVASLVLLNEYKRRQAAPGIRITQRAFGKDRRYPITSAYRKYL
jgi:NAD+ synthase (glutamine-hydrolysing)